MLDLSYFSLVLRQRLVVGNLQNSAGACLPECHFEVIACHLGVPNRVMQNRFTVSEITIDQAEMIEAAWEGICVLDETAFRKTVEGVIDVS